RCRKSMLRVCRDARRFSNPRRISIDKSGSMWYEFFTIEIPAVTDLPGFLLPRRSRRVPPPPLERFCMTAMTFVRPLDPQARKDASPRGLSCDEEGLFLGDCALIRT